MHENSGINNPLDDWLTRMFGKYKTMLLSLFISVLVTFSVLLLCGCCVFFVFVCSVCFCSFPNRTGHRNSCVERTTRWPSPSVRTNDVIGRTELIAEPGGGGGSRSQGSTRVLGGRLSVLGSLTGVQRQA